MLYYLYALLYYDFNVKYISEAVFLHCLKKLARVLIFVLQVKQINLLYNTKTFIFLKLL